MSQYKALVEGIHACERCFFWNPMIQPLAPSFSGSPVPIMFIGENPSWAPGQNIPFDQRTISGLALDANYLSPLGFNRNRVWVTDLFKCRYPKDIGRKKTEYERRTREEVVASCLHWLVEEILISRPLIIVTLSNMNVYQRFRDAFSLTTPKTFSIAVGKAHSINISNIRILLFPMIHPDVSRTPGDGDNRKMRTRERWAPIHRDIHIPELKRLIDELG